MVLKAIIEMPAWTNYKYEIKENQLILDRVLDTTIPANYGFVPDTLAADMDPLDIFVLSTKPLLAGALVEATPRCVFLCEDGGVQDDKVVAVLKGEENFSGLDVSLIQGYLQTYKNGFKVLKQITFDEYYGSVPWPK